MSLFLNIYYVSTAIMLLFCVWQVRVLWQISDNVPNWLRVALLILCTFCPAVNTILVVALLAAYIKSYWS